MEGDKERSAVEIQVPASSKEETSSSNSKANKSNNREQHGKKKKGGKSVCPEALQRMQFLLGASSAAAAGASPSPTSALSAKSALSAHLGAHLVGVGRKAVVRLEAEAKRSLCRGCRVSLVPGATARAILERRSGVSKSGMQCLRCGTTRTFLLKEKKPFLRSKNKKGRRRKK